VPHNRGDIPVRIDRLVRQIRRIDERHAGLERRLARTKNTVGADRLARSMAAISNQRVTPAAEVVEWLNTLPVERREALQRELGIGEHRPIP